MQKGTQAMNERFFELKKDRQDRIINGAMRIFALNGYRHASTDEMVAAASISKGLLFHYFKSKKGTWEFLYEYSTRYTLLELREAQRRRGCDFFEMYRQLVRVDSAVLKKYPYMPLFLRRADYELGMDDPKFKPEIPENLRRAVADSRLSLVIEADRPPFLSEQDARRISQMLEYTRFGLIQELLEREDETAGPNHEQYAERLNEYLQTLRKMNI